MSWTGCNFVPVNQPLDDSSKVWIEFKLPYNSSKGIPVGAIHAGGSVTGWLDATQAFGIGLYENGDGCLDGTLPVIPNTDWKINFGLQSTYYSSGIVLMRITAGPAWTGYIDKIDIST